MKHLLLYISIALSALFTSCSMMHQDEEDCSTHLRIEFVDSINLKYADAFDHEVKTVTLYAYASDGHLAFTRTESAEDINARGGYMDFTDIAPDTYTFTVWATGEERYADTYTLGEATATADNEANLTRRIARTDADIRHDLTPLFHGRLEAQKCDDLRPQEIRTLRMPLMKDTKNLRIVLQNLSGSILSHDDFAFVIEDNNGFLGYDNSLLADDSLRYHEWYKTSGMTTVDDGKSPALKTRSEITSASAVYAELTLNRLMKTHRPMLNVYNLREGKRIISIPLIEYALMVKGYYNQGMSDQEYLDRQDEYEMIFFIDDDYTWLSASVIINSWRVVISKPDLGS